MKIFLAIVAGVLGLLVLRQCFFTVDASEYAYVTVLGRHVATFDGSNPDEAGLHFSWPWPVVSIQRLDRRLQGFDLPATELLTHDPMKKDIDKTLSVEAYVVWKIADQKSVDRFVQRIGSNDRARAILGPRINSQLGAEIGKLRMEDLVSTKTADDGKPRVDGAVRELRNRMLAALKAKVTEEYGIQLEDVRLRRFSNPGEVRESIFKLIRSERDQKVSESLSEGEKTARIIEADADRKVQEMLAEARLAETRIRSEAETRALALRNQAQSLDPEYFAFLKQMEKLQAILSDSRSVLLLSAHRPMFDLLFNPPKLTPEKKK